MTKRSLIFLIFFKQKSKVKKILKKNSSVYFSKFLLAIEHYNNKKLTIDDYNNIDLLSSYKKGI